MAYKNEPQDLRELRFFSLNTARYTLKSEGKFLRSKYFNNYMKKIAKKKYYSCFYE